MGESECSCSDKKAQSFTMVPSENSTVDTSKRLKTASNDPSGTNSNDTTRTPRKPVENGHSPCSSTSPQKTIRRRYSSGSSSSSSSISSLTSLNSCDDTIDTTGLSVVKTLTLLRSQPANRSCADCRSALIDPSSVYASICMVAPNGRKTVDENHKTSSRKIALQDFRLTHRAFAPPIDTGIPAVEVIANETDSKNKVDDIFVSNGSHTDSNEYEDDPSFSANQRFGGHGVFICKKCAEAHRELGSSIKVKSVTDSSLWTTEEVQFIVANGGNAQCWKIYEGFVPDQWKERRPIFASSLSVRILFCRAKYEALAFCLPQPGPNARKAWEIILRKQQDRNKRAPGSANLKNITSLSVSNHSLNVGSSTKTSKRGLPNRLMDYFCVVTSSMQLLPSKLGKKKKEKKIEYSSISSPEGLDFWPHVTDCYPPQNTHGVMGYEDHISSFVMPGGCHPTLDPKPPSFSTFVLTMADGSFVYGGSLQVYDEHVDAEEMKRAIRDSGYEGEFPSFLKHHGETTNGSDVFFFPKCLVFLSRYAFFDLFRSVLLEIYQISLIAAPLPIERYVSNFMCEVPLPPQGQVRVEFSFTTDRKFCIERPPINKLPMANFSYRPMFACLSVSNILVVLGYLLQECKVVLLSRHYSLLTPVAEALLSAIFPFRWVGLYIPVAPLKMKDILDAPIPYLIGISSEYFDIVSPRHRPKDAILVDLDRDVILVGDLSLPRIPEHDAQKLATSLEEAGGSVYVIPNSGVKGCIMAGSKKPLVIQNENRPRYAHMTIFTDLEQCCFFRDELFSSCDLAYGKNDDESARIIGFGSINGQLTNMTEEADSSNGRRKSRSTSVTPLKRLGRNKKANILSRNESAMNQAHLLDLTELEGFSVEDIRKAFLRFTVATFADYQDSLLEDSDRDLFDGEKFVEDVGPRDGSMVFIKNVLRSQLFQRFLEERKENPEIPEIRFFDESIIAKRNRSKRETLAKGGKKPTPFLDDRTTWEVTKIFTPPTPNNLGLPDAEETYRYGVFPILDETRFGRIRPPITWRQHTCLDAVINTKSSASKMKKSQNEFVKNALKPVLGNQTAIAAVAKRTARDLESTLAALSIVPALKRNSKMTNIEAGELGNISASKYNVKTLSTADTIMMDARRKQSILLDFIIRIQALCRGFLARDYYALNKFQILESRRNEHQWTNVIIIQRFARMCLARKKKQRMLQAIILIQSNQRASWRARRARIIFGEVRRVVMSIQSVVRGGVVRKKMKTVMEQKMDLYTTQIFVLWTHLHIPLIFRAKLWPDIAGGKSFLRLRLAESELLRLWKIAGLSARLSGAKVPDKIAEYCTSFGISNDVYYQSKKCADLIQNGASISSSIDKGLPFEQTERLQIYERLSSSISDKDISTLYRNFDIAEDEKMKKVALSKVLWTKIALADRSATSMTFIFPELKNSLGISFLKPSRKGQRRFPSAFRLPVPPIDSDLWEEISMEGKTKRHVQEVAMLFITRVPELFNKLDLVLMTSKDTDFDTFLRAVMEAKGLQNREQARRHVIQQYIHSNRC